jgi:hypothetical protein
MDSSKSRVLTETRAVATAKVVAKAVATLEIMDSEEVTVVDGRTLPPRKQQIALVTQENKFERLLYLYRVGRYHA